MHVSREWQLGHHQRISVAGGTARVWPEMEVMKGRKTEDA